VIQPGSSVATSLCEGEAVEKHVAVIEVHKKGYRVRPIPLATVRPFVMKQIHLARDSGIKNPTDRTEVTAFLIRQVESAIREATDQWSSRASHREPSQSQSEPPLPLIRLRVDYTGPDGGPHYTTENPQRFSNRFVGRVANPQDIVQYMVKRRTAVARNPQVLVQADTTEDVRIQDLMMQYLTGQSLEILPESGLGQAVCSFVEKDDRNAMRQVLESTLEEYMQRLIASGEPLDESLTTALPVSGNSFSNSALTPEGDIMDCDDGGSDPTVDLRQKKPTGAQRPSTRKPRTAPSLSTLSSEGLPRASPAISSRAAILAESVSHTAKRTTSRGGAKGRGALASAQQDPEASRISRGPSQKRRKKDTSDDEFEPLE
jgi:double-strand break repair protein MRE11